jgi:hypothetical protein
MKLRLFAAVALVCTGLVAQEGHPLKGTWHGSWGVDGKERTSVTLVMDWDGKAITGILNPGLRSSPLEKTSLDPSNWQVHLEANHKDRTGAISRVVIDARIQDVTNPRRSLVGTWTEGGQKGDFKAVRDD